MKVELKTTNPLPSSSYLDFKITYRRLRGFDGNKLSRTKLRYYRRYYFLNDKGKRTGKIRIRKSERYIPDFIIIDGKDISVEIIAGGMHWDDNVECFGDYYNTIYRMYNMLLEKGCKEPFTLISDKETKEYAGTGNNMCLIAVDYDIEFNAIEMYDLQNVSGLIKEVCVCERDYILSRNWIDKWLVVDQGILGDYDEKYGDYRLMLTNGNIGIITGGLTIA